MSYSLITVERRDAVALITLNRPDKLNAWTPAMAVEQARAIEEANDDPAVGAIVMTGAGRGFCAGADMEATFKSRIDGVDPGEDTAGGSGGMPASLDWVGLLRRSKPLVAAVNGAAVGVGMTMILPFDVIVTSEKAKFGMLFIKVGLVPELASTHFLVQRIGFGRASEMCLSGRLYWGAEAHAWGLADRLSTPESLLDEAFKVAGDIAANPDPQLRMIKALLSRNGSDTDLGAVQRLESDMLRHCWKSPEHKEAVTAFLEKRPPRFRRGATMATATVNGVRVFYEVAGRGDVPLVLVHGSWDSHQTWELVVPRLAESFRVVTYDRRGHSRSERPAAQGSVREDVADLAALIEHLGLAPAWIVGNSFGALIALRLAGERPDLFRGLIVHEPPLFPLLADDPALAPLLQEVGQRIPAVVERIASGDHSGAAEQFVDTVALGPGSWATIPPDLQRILIENAPTFLDETRDTEALAFDLEWLEAFAKPALLTRGAQSPPTFSPVIDKIATALPQAEVFTFPNAGHVPHATDPDAYVESILAFTSTHRA